MRLFVLRKSKSEIEKVLFPDLQDVEQLHRNTKNIGRIFNNWLRCQMISERFGYALNRIVNDSQLAI